MGAEGWLALEVHSRSPQPFLNLQFDQLLLIHLLFLLDQLDLLGLAREVLVVVDEDSWQLKARLESALQRDILLPLFEHFPTLHLPKVTFLLYL